MEKIVPVDAVGRIVLPKAIRDAVNLGQGGPVKVRLAPGGIIEIEAIAPARRRLKKVGKFLIAVSDRKVVYDAAADVRAERAIR
jgi:AbrB family looped-hinge helix DNA binding protein